MTRLRLYLAQIDPTVGDIAGNEAKVLGGIRDAVRAGATLVLFPEMVITGYPPEDLLFKPEFIRRGIDSVRRLARSLTGGTAALVGYADTDASGGVYNATAWIERGRILGVYRKRCLPNYGVFDEKRHFRRGGSAAYALLPGGVRIGLTICEDIWDPSADVYQSAYRGSASLIVNLSASPYHRAKIKERSALIGRLARRCRAHVAYLNLVGGQDELVFDGGSLLYDPAGRRIAQMPLFEESALCLDLELSAPARRPLGGAHVWRSRASGRESAPPIRMSLAPRLSPEAETYKALVLGTRDYVRKNGFKKVVIGMSGGVDSALVAVIAVDAIGAENVLLVTMPSRYTSAATYRDALAMARRLGVRCTELPIGRVLRAYRTSLRPALGGPAKGPTEENLQARIRGNFLMAISNRYGHLVLTTGNKSEMATGYCTLYGDMAGGFAVIKDVSKTLVYELCRYRNTLGKGPLIPASILRRAPTAELRHGQKDQDTLPPYDQVDRFLEIYVERDGSVDRAIRSGVPSAAARKLATLIDRNEYKRRQAPPGVKISPKAFGRDRRMPITNRYSD